MIISRQNKICGQVSIKMIINTFFCERKMPVLACAVLCLVALLCSPPGSSVHGDSPGKNTGVGSLSLLQGNFPTQELNQGLLHCTAGRFFNLS